MVARVAVNTVRHVLKAVLCLVGGGCLHRPAGALFFLCRQKVMAAAAAGPVGVHMELGGKGAMIVFDDVQDIDATVDW